MGIENHVSLRCRYILIVPLGDRFDLVSIVEEHAQVTNSANTRMEASRCLANFLARITKDAFFRLTGSPTVVSLLVRTGRNTHPPAATLILVDQNNTVFTALVYGSRRTTGNTSGIQAMIADA